jgi:hypothetical protein
VKRFVNQIQLAPRPDYFIVNNGGRTNKGRVRPARACQSNWNKIRISFRMRRIRPSKSRKQNSFFTDRSDREASSIRTLHKEIQSPCILIFPFV